MLSHYFEFRAIAVGIAVVATISISVPAVASDKAQTPEPAKVPSQNTSPYVPPPDIIVPESSNAYPADAGKRSHTNILIRKQSGKPPRKITKTRKPKPSATTVPPDNAK